MVLYTDILPKDLVFDIIVKIRTREDLDVLLEIYKFRLILNDHNFLLLLIKYINVDVSNLAAKSDCTSSQLRMVYYYLLYQASGQYARAYISIKDIDLNAPGYITDKFRSIPLTWEDVYNNYVGIKAIIDCRSVALLRQFFSPTDADPSPADFLLLYSHNYDMFDKFTEITVKKFGFDDTLNLLHGITPFPNVRSGIPQGRRGPRTIYQNLLSEGIIDTIELSIREKFS